MLVTTSLWADEFSEITPGNFVRLGVHEDITADDHRGVANIGFIIGERSVAVIDPGGSAGDASALKVAIASRTELPISHIVLTHFHPDHILAGQLFNDVPTVVAHRRYAAAMAQRGEHYWQRFAGLLGPDSAVNANTQAQSDGAWLLPTLAVAEHATVDLGNRELDITAHPTAHTDNDITVLDTRTGTLWASDLVFAERVPALDGSLTGWLQVLRALAATAPRLVVPGHGKPGSWDTVVAPQISYLEQLLEQTRSAIKAGQSLAAIVSKAEKSTDKSWLLYGLYHTRNQTKAFSELEWE